MSTITLKNERWQVLLSPEQGNGVLGGFVHHKDDWLPVMPDTRQAEIDLDCASFLMIPYSNRVEHGRFQFAGQSHQLAHGPQHAIHGDVQERPWTIESKSETHVICTLDTRNFPDFNWPWAFTAYAEYRLEDDTFISKLKVKNCDERAMRWGWAGILTLAAV